MLGKNICLEVQRCNVFFDITLDFDFVTLPLTSCVGFVSKNRRC